MAHETAVYTHGHHDSVLRSHRARTAANSAAYLVPELRPDARVLDIGCGPGTITADLAALVAQGSVTGLDAAEGVLETARAAAAERGLSNVEFTTGDVHALAFPDAAFDVVHAHQTLQHVGDPVAALREMRRVCAPGGLVAVRDADYGGMFWYPEVPVLDEWLDLYRRVAVSNGGVPDAGRRLHAWAREAGFANVTLSTSTWTFSSPRSGPGGAACGPSARWPPATPGSRSAPDWRTARTWNGSPPRGAPGASRRMPGSRWCTARSSAGSDGSVREAGACLIRGVAEPGRE